MGKDDSTGLLENSISLTQNVNANSDGCCCKIKEVLTYIKDLKYDIALLLAANGINVSSGKVLKQKYKIIQNMLYEKILKN